MTKDSNVGKYSGAETAPAHSKERKRVWWRRWWLVTPVGLLSLCMLGAFLLVVMTQGTSGAIPIHRIQQHSGKIALSPIDSICLLSINMAHARGDGGNQIFQADDVFVKNITAISEIIEREQAHIVALQEADVAIVMVDGRSGLPAADEHVAERPSRMRALVRP